MNDQELANEFIRIKRDDDGVRLAVRHIRWDGPGTPVSYWVDAKLLPAGTADAAVQEEVGRILEDAAHFGVCAECHERNPRGWMHRRDLCQRCAERNHGVVY
jgi:hypothetical protein